jgi:hypothetical protein
MELLAAQRRLRPMRFFEKKKFDASVLVEAT